MQLARYLFTRIISYVLVISVGMTVVFVIPRLTPQNPVISMVARLTSQGTFMEPEALEAMRDSLMETFGLSGTIWQQYVAFWKRAITGDFGPSFAVFPTPVNELIVNALPWTMGLLIISTLIAWVIGNLVGLIAGYRSGRWYSRALESIAVVIYPIPYYILALILILFASYGFGVFVVGVGGYAIGLRPGWNWPFILSVIKNSLLPALSIVLINYGWWFLSMKALSSDIAEEDYVKFAEIKGIPVRHIMTRYVMRNALLPQVTQLAMALGTVFGGALLTEVVFAYPGLGSLVYMAVSNADYNLMMGITSLSIIAVASAGLIIDLAYPLLDPRVRY